jgi:hypothetical protein
MSDAVTNQLPTGLTIGEAEAWRDGWRAARDRAAFLAFERGAWASNELDSDSVMDRFHAEPRMEMSREISTAIKAMEPPA